MGVTSADRTRRESGNSTGSDVLRFTDISSFTPPTVQFTIGTPPAGGRLRSFSGSTHQQVLVAKPLPGGASRPRLPRRSGGVIPEGDGMNYIQRSGSRLSENGLLLGHFALSGGGSLSKSSSVTSAVAHCRLSVQPSDVPAPVLLRGAGVAGKDSAQLVRGRHGHALVSHLSLLLARKLRIKSRGTLHTGIARGNST
ncbi:hypothetical protein AVEN_125130-1 [Araneus ventricosus]|uniref:Uncharacterized protein n=1 Tax=Araneus ventricosus TaxID=182803 RepID=A0A4Y2RWE7_ARAVE|nr:hypothetical protein AVEN_125130-1 [Araneus ventricosus]